MPPPIPTTTTRDVRASNLDLKATAIDASYKRHAVSLLSTVAIKRARKSIARSENEDENIGSVTSYAASQKSLFGNLPLPLPIHRTSA